MDHIVAWPRLDAYLDCGLDTETRLSVTEHLTGCRTCQTYLAEQARFRLATRERLNTVRAPQGLATRIRTRLLAEPDSPVPTRTIRTLGRGKILTFGAILAVLCLIVVSWLVLRSGPANQGSVRELAVQHVAFGQDDEALEVRGSPGNISVWFQGRVPYTVTAYDLPGYVLQGGRLAVVNEQRAAQLIYQQEGTENYISLFYFMDPPRGTTFGMPADYTLRRFGDLSVVMWPQGETQAALVAGITDNALLEIARARR